MTEPQAISPEIVDWRRRRRAAKLAEVTQRMGVRASARRMKIGNREVVVLKRSRHAPIAAS